MNKILSKSVWLFILMVFVTTNGIKAHAQDLPTLSTLLVNPEDIKANYKNTLYAFTRSSEHVWVIDHTEELENHCPVDCVKMVWYVPVRDYWPNGYRKLTIILIRTTTSGQANRAVEDLYQQFHDPTNPNFWDHTDDFNWKQEGLSSNTWAVYNNSFVLCTSYESTIILLSMKMRGFRDIVDMAEIRDLTDYTKLQVTKLKEAGY